MRFSSKRGGMMPFLVRMLSVGMLGLWLAAGSAGAAPAGGGSSQPVLVGIDGEFGLANSTSAQAVELGLRAAVAEINVGGGVLGGRPIEIVVRDHRSMPARGIRNIEEFASMPGLVAVFGGRFSPVVIEELPALKRTRVLFMAVWSSADIIVDNGMQPNYIFRLSLRDSLAMPAMLKSAAQRGFGEVGLLLTNTSWGRSNLAAAEKFFAGVNSPRLVGTRWYNWRDTSLIDKYEKLRAAGAKAIVLVANDDEAAVLVKEVAALPPEQRLPIISHWGVTGGEFVQQAGPALQQVDFSVIQTFSFFNADPKRVERFLQSASKVSNVRRIEDIQGPVGAAHAYDMMHILAKAIDLAGSTERDAVRKALERVPEHRGLIKHYRPPFAPGRHEALGVQELLMARYRADGVLVPLK
ncbi:amino acid/amide ABC transporter substrate-binding protein, HAAT family [Noviherbaspirillum humi]|uniref:Amino acid/amide ABC transporter substrate-binding protein, HAAT family n=1 Tax=Noviherbaspirillum humi TaxID=1688639 RepID=A0A239L785_9BURK|nr:ABC transporter substrate-binding protein [Noviherbaspirillum humi]SNT25394.1 amino acid/amide ABC transporter substrate-binding protein, HAAT family [Noviherbaspirillum humi]